MNKHIPIFILPGFVIVLSVLLLRVFMVVHILTNEGNAIIPVEVLRVLGFFSSPGLLSVLEAERHITIKFAVVAKEKKNVCVSLSVCVCARMNILCVVPRGFLAAVVVAVRVDAVVRIDGAVLLAAVAVPFLVAAVELVEAVVLLFGTRGRLSAVV